MNKALFFLALALTICGVTFGLVRSKAQTVIHAEEGIFTDHRLTLIRVSPTLSYTRSAQHGTESITSYIVEFEGSKTGALVFKNPGGEDFTTIDLELSAPVYDSRRNLLSFYVKTATPPPAGSFLEPVLQIH